MDKTEQYTVADISLAETGALRVDWARARMPVLASLREEALKTKPLAGMRVTGCLHVTKETAILIETLAAAGAEMYVRVNASSYLELLLTRGCCWNRGCCCNRQ